MKPFRKRVAIAIDGGGIRGVMVTKALEALEVAQGKKLDEIFQLAAGTSTGSIIAAGIALGLRAAEMTDMYRQRASEIFARTLRHRLWFLVNYRLPGALKVAILPMSHFLFATEITEDTETKTRLSLRSLCPLRLI